VLGAPDKSQPPKPPRRADELGDLVLLDHDGSPVRLADLWRDGAVALVWIRHYG
jgi:hypothetical protein